MSLKERLYKVKADVSASYDACDEKGAIIPEVKNSENLAATIETIVKIDLEEDSVDLGNPDVDNEESSSGLIIKGLKDGEVYTTDGLILDIKNDNFKGKVELKLPDGTILRTEDGTLTLPYHFTSEVDLDGQYEITAYGEEEITIGLHENEVEPDSGNGEEEDDDITEPEESQRFSTIITKVDGTPLLEGETEEEKILTINIPNASSSGSDYTIEVIGPRGVITPEESTVDKVSYMITLSGNYAITMTQTIDGITKIETKLEIINLKTPETAKFSRATGIIDIVWLDKDNNVIDKPESPILGNLVPVKWNGEPGNYTEVTTTESDPDWYNYLAQVGNTESGGTSKWANAKTSNGDCYFVWIPRYAYKITYYDGNAAVGYSNIDGIFDITDGAPKLITGTEPKNVTGKVNSEVYADYIPHPAFEFDGSRSGIWVGKYESSGNTTTIQIKPSVTSIVSQTISSLFNAAFNVKTIYNLNGDTHMLKNIEWGVAAYLTDSKYGRNGTKITINNYSAMKSGYAGKSVSAGSESNAANVYEYNTAGGVLASTTGNIYGIYDISGGAIEYVVGNLEGFIGSAGTTGTFGTIYNGPLKNKYIDSYAYSGISGAGGNQSNYNANMGIKGDAIVETSVASTDGNDAWHNSLSLFIHTDRAWFIRGGYYLNTTNSGQFLFYAGASNGGINTLTGVRVCFIPED